MIWKLKNIQKETEHRFLNFYTFTYEVQKDGETLSYPYFIASRREENQLLAKTGDFKRPDGVLIAVYDEKNESLLLIEEFRPGINATVVEFPAGLLDEGDKDEHEAAYREAVEEAGVELYDIELLCRASPTSAGLSDEMVSVVLGKVKGLTSTHLEKFEDIQARFIPLSEIPSLLEDQNLVIALNVRLCLLYLLERYGRKDS